VKTSSYVGTKSDQFLLAQIFLDVVGARLNPEVRRFRWISTSLLLFFFFILVRENIPNLRSRHTRRSWWIENNFFELKQHPRKNHKW